jgi:polyferredoxin
MLGRLDRVFSKVSLRWIVKGAFLAYFVIACVRLFRFAAWARGAGPFVSRPEAPAGLLPLGHFMSFFAWLRGGGWDVLLPAGLVIILGAFAVSFLFKRGFCGWICPVGTVWDACALLGRKLMGGRNISVPRWLDLTGRASRYLITAAAVLFLGVLMPLDQAVAFRSFEYMRVADLKTIGGMLQPGYLALLGFAGLLSVVFGPVWCRYLCPVGGLYSAAGVLSPCAVTRDDGTCIHCGRCTNVCHARIDVERATTVRGTECDGCMECVRACPVDECLEAKALGRVRIKSWAWPLLVVAVYLAVFGVAKLTGDWDTRITTEQFRATITSGELERPSTPEGRRQTP